MAFRFYCIVFCLGEFPVTKLIWNPINPETYIIFNRFLSIAEFHSYMQAIISHRSPIKQFYHNHFVVVLLFVGKNRSTKPKIPNCIKKWQLSVSSYL